LYRVALLALSLAALPPQGAVAQSSSGPYAEARIGAVFVEDADFDESPLTGELTYDPGYALDLAFGYAFEVGLRLELQLGYRKSDVDEIKIDGVGAIDADTTDLTTYTSMANLYYDFDFARLSSDPGDASRLVPYLGGGIGVAIHELGVPDVGGGTSGMGIAYQGIAGFAYSLAPDWRLTLTYIYLRISDPEFDDLDTEYSSHNAMLGVRYSF
jgi:opacity protein-like surface antigen